ncbi:MAG: sulfotransferase [Bacteroidales bacterium]
MLEKIKFSLLYLKERTAFSQVEQFCMFTGYPRSGHSLVGAMMDAHPEMVISHELDVLEMLIQGFNYRQIYAMILQNSREFARKGRTWSGYSYEIKGAWQGKFRKLKVIGDKRGGRTSMLLTENFSLIEKLKNNIPVPIRFIHVVRNPFDNIITRVRQGNDVRKEITPEGVREHIHRHFEQAATNHRVITESGCHVLTIRHEDLISNPGEVLVSICNFLELEAPVKWLNACTGIVFKKPKKTRHEFDYPKEMIDEIMEKMGRFPFFEGYSFFD